MRPQRPVIPYRQRQTEARAERMRRARALRRGGNRYLANGLEGCLSGQRCGLGVCPTCHARLQQRLAKAIRCFAKGAHGKGVQLVVVTWVPSDAGIAPGQLHLRDHENQMRAWKRRLKSTNLQWAVGGVDFSFNVDQERDSSRPATWSPHLCLMGGTRDVEELRTQLRATTQVTAATPRPVVVKRWDGRLNAPLYAFKGEFTRRVSYMGERYDRRQGRLTPCRQTSKQRLLASQKLELWQHLDKIGLTRRIFSLRAQVHRKQGQVSIRQL